MFTASEAAKLSYHGPLSFRELLTGQDIQQHAACPDLAARLQEKTVQQKHICTLKGYLFDILVQVKGHIVVCCLKYKDNIPVTQLK